MESVRKINLLDATQGQVYHDKFGWVGSKISVEAKGKKIDRYNNSTEIKIANGNFNIGYESNGNITQKSFSDISSQLNNRQLLDFDFCTIKIYYRNYGGYVYNENIEIHDPQITYLWQGIVINKTSEIEVYEGERRDLDLKDWQIKENLRVQYHNDHIKGTFVVTEVFEQPNRENKLCVIEPLIKSESSEKEIKPITINCNQNVLRSVPYETYDEAPDETSIFNEPLNEEMLAPFVEKTTDQSKEANLYWLPIEEASGYSVTLYKKRNNDADQQKNKVYFLQRFEIDRNKHWLTLNDLIGKGYIIILEAENRQGQIIAKTRGINLDTKKLEWF